MTKKIWHNNGWDNGDTEYLASLTETDIRDWMLAAPDDLVGKIRAGLLFFGQLSGATDEENKRYRKIYNTTVAALRSIASTSELNRRRVTTIYDIPEVAKSHD